MAAGLNVVVGADVSSVQSAMNILQTQFQRLQRLAAMPGLSLAQYERLNRMMLQTQARMEALRRGAQASGQSLNGLSASAGRNTQTYTNLGRVIQDLPYGFTGIQNNLTQLIPSVGILGLAFSGLISAITFSQTGLSNWTRGLKGAKGDLLAFNESLEGAKEEYVKATSTVSLLKKEIDLAKNGFIDKDRVVKEYNETIGKTTGLVTSLDQAERELNKNAKAYIQFTLLKAAANVALGKAADEAFKIQENLETKTTGKVGQARSKQIRTEAAIAANKVADEAKKAGKSQAEIEKAYNDAFDEAISKGLSPGETVRKQKFEKISDDLLNQAAELSKKFKFNFFQDTGEDKKSIDKIINKAKQVAAFFNKTTIFSTAFEVDPFDSEAETVRKAKKFISTITKVIDGADPFKSLKQAGLDGIIIKLKPEFFQPLNFIDKIKIKLLAKLTEGFKFDEPQIVRSYDVLRKEFEKKLDELAARHPALINVRAKVTDIKIEEARKAFDQNLFGIKFAPTGPDGKPLFTNEELQARKFATTITGIVTPAFQDLFAAIQAGESPLKAFFQSLGESVLQLIQKLIAAAIQAAILSALFPGGIGGAKGFGSIFKSLVGFASGGIVSGPVLAMVGEGPGTSRSNPEVIAPLDQLKGMLQGMAGRGQMQPIVLHTRIKGNDLELVSNRTGRKNRRAGS